MCIKNIFTGGPGVVVQILGWVAVVAVVGCACNFGFKCLTHEKGEPWH